MTCFRIAAVSALALFCAACQPAPEGGNDAAANAATDAATAAPEPVRSPEPEPSPEPAPAEANAARPLLSLAPDGLMLVMADSGRSAPVNFGIERAMATRMVDAALDAPTGHGANAECGAGPLDAAEYRGGLTLYFQGGKFVGWDLDGDGTFSTANGIMIGMSRAALENAGSEVTMVPDSTIGNEFTIGALSGLLSDKGPGGKVTNLWAGTTCVFR